MSPRFWSLLVVAALLLVAGGIAAPGPVAHARTAAFHVPLASCASSGCNGLDAYRTSCAGSGASYWVVDSVPVNWQGVNAGWVQLWYSGPCGTNWARSACSSVCRAVSLTLFVCDSAGLSDAVQGPLSLSGTGRTNQEYLPATKAAASVLFNVGGRVFSGATTGCYSSYVHALKHGGSIVC